ncbi:MAG: hypothetical protein AAF192_22450 [Pseudomonadota bacterium]
MSDSPVNVNEQFIDLRSPRRAEPPPNRQETVFVKTVAPPLDHPLIVLAADLWPLAVAIAGVWAIGSIRERMRASRRVGPVVLPPHRKAAAVSPLRRGPRAARRPAKAAALVGAVAPAAARGALAAAPSRSASISTCRVCGQPLDLRNSGSAPMCACDGRPA